MSRTVLKRGSKISLVNSKNGEPLDLEIISEPLGEGSSCIAYEAESTDDRLICKYRLKELYPENIDGLFRDNENRLVIPESCREDYLKACKRFDRSLELLWEFAYSNDTGCYTVCPLGRFEGRTESGTPASYLITQWLPSDNISVANLCSKNDLHLAAKICFKTAVAVKEFHKKGYLNFDIKPENILYSFKTDTIAFFDTDTVFKKGDNEEACVFFSEGAAPEIVNGFEKLYSEKSDIFSIGSMLHRFITGENYYSGQYSLNFEAERNKLSEYKMLKYASPAATALIIKIFGSCNAGNPVKRCSGEELAEMLSELAEMTSPHGIYVCGSYIQPPKNNDIAYVDEFYSIRKILLKEHFLFIQGLHRSGKTEFARGYASDAKQYYHTVVWADYSGSIKETVAEIKFSGIDDNDYDSIDKLFQIKFEYLKKYDEGVLLIVDGYNEPDNFAEEFLGSLKLHILITSACNSNADNAHIYTMKKDTELIFSKTETAEFREKMSKLKKVNRSLRTFYTLLFSLSLSALVISAALYEFVSKMFSSAMIISVLVTVILRSLIFGRTEKEAVFGICEKNCEKQYKTASLFGSSINNQQTFEISAPGFIPFTEKDRHRFRVMIGASAIFFGIVTAIISFLINSFPFLAASYAIILVVIFSADFGYSTYLIKKTYKTQFGELRNLYEVYSFKSKSDSDGVSEKISPECARQIIYNQYKTKCDLWGAADVFTKILAAVNILAVLLLTFSAFPSEYFRIPENIPAGAFLFTVLAVFCIVSCMTVTTCKDFYYDTKDLLFTVCSEDSKYAMKKFNEYTENSAISDTSYARGVFNFAITRFEKGIPIYEIRKSERPTFKHYCITQRARTTVYFPLIATAEFCMIVWHFSLYYAVIPLTALNIGFYIWWNFFGMYKFNKKLLGIVKR